MGSGSGSNYSSGGSQPYAPTYHVVGSMMEKDKANPDIYSPSTGYFKNPTAPNLEKADDGNRIVFNGKRAEGTMTYVLDTNGNIIFGKRLNPNNSKGRAPHPTLIGGKNPQVQCAGMITFKKGKILSVDDNSGHFRPSSKSMQKVDKALQKLYDKNPNLFHPDSKWRKNK